MCLLYKILNPCLANAATVAAACRLSAAVLEAALAFCQDCHIAGAAASAEAEYAQRTNSKHGWKLPGWLW